MPGWGDRIVSRSLPVETRSNVVVVEIVGPALMLVGVAWIFLSAWVAGGTPRSAAGALLAATIAFLVARIVSGRVRWMVPLVLVVGAGVLAWRFRSDLLSRRPLSGPLGYRNASAALYLQASVAGWMLTAMWRAGIARVVALCAALGFGVAAILANSLAIDLLLVLLATAIIVARRVAIPILAGAFLVSIVASAVLGATYTPGDRSGMIDRVVGSTLSERRPALWHDAIALIVESPVTGVGPGRFAAESPIARSDLDARWAHNEFLQFGAEVGVVGLIVLLLVFVWAFVRLQLESASDIVRILAAASLAAVGIHATVDYVLHFPLLVIAAASLLAVGLSTPALPRE